MNTLSKISLKYSTALRGQEKDFLTKEEFVVFALDNKEFVRRLSH